MNETSYILNQNACEHTDQLSQLINTVRHVPAATVLINAAGTILAANHAAEQLFGYDVDTLQHKPLDILIPHDRREIHASLLTEFAQTPTNCPKGTGLPRHGLRQDGKSFEAEISFKPITQGETVIFLATVYDISAFKKTEAELRQINRSLRFLCTVNQLITRTSDPGILLQGVCRAAVEASSYRMAWVGLAEHLQDKKIRPIAFHGFNNGFIEKLNLSWAEHSANQTPVAEAIRKGKTVVCNNMFTSPRTTPCRADAKQRGYQSVAALPLQSRENLTWGVLVLFASEASAFGQKERAILHELSCDLSRSLQESHTYLNASQ